MNFANFFLQSIHSKATSLMRKAEYNYSDLPFSLESVGPGFQS